jgi:outer membrane protein assembly factor BamD
MSTIDINFAGISYMKNKSVIRLAFAALSIFIAVSCSDYQKISRSPDSSVKYNAALQYLKKEQYAKALPLFESLQDYFRNTPKGEEIDYDLAYCYFKTNQYQLASFQYKNFIEQYPTSAKNDEASYMYAYCLYMQSPVPNLDQASTTKAIEGFQDYLAKYPDSKHVDEINKNIDELRNKLERKDIDNATLYYKIEDYKSAVWAIRNVIQQYPASAQREWLEYLVVKSSYELAKNSVSDKQEERMRQTLAYYTDFRDRYPTSKYDADLKKIMKDTNTYLDAIKSVNNEHQ